MAIPESHGKDGKPLAHERQRIILECLEAGEALSITALAKEWGVSSKTVQRDFDKLTAMGRFGIERAADGRKYQKARTRRAYNESEMVIEAIDAMARDIGGGFYTKAHQLLKRLREGFETPYYTRIDVEDISSKFGIVKTLEGTILDRQSVTFEYTPWWGDGTRKHYTGVHPLRIVVFNGFWYLLAEHEGIYKKFYLKEISQVRAEGGTFNPDQKILDRLENSLNIWFEPEKEPWEVTLWVEPESVVYFERRPVSRTQKLYKQPDGSAELIIRITDEAEILPLVKFYLPTIRILEPEPLRKSFEKMLQGYLEG
jgi:predicted DNA-binding transcriptional regulator YafY